MNIDILNYYYREAKKAGYLEFDDKLMNELVLMGRNRTRIQTERL